MLDERRSERFRALLSPFLPPAALDDMVQYIISYSIHLKITRERHSKLGDYRLPTPQQPGHTISVNGNLNPHAFLLVLLHELAHMLTFLDCGRSVRPHGHEWQQHYSRLLQHYTDVGGFPPDVVPMLREYYSKIPLSKRLEREIDRQLQVIVKPENTVRLDSLPTGTRFRIGRRARMFELIERQRTRWKCRDVATGRLYTVAADAMVEVVISH